MIDLLLERVLFLVPLWASLGVHEWAHARAAYALGDDTAARLGRMTLDPTAHVDPIGTVVLPLVGVPFGWAKPVPVEPTRFRPEVSMGTGLLLVAAAGPLSNLVLALLALAAQSALGSDVPPLAARLVQFVVWSNFALAIVNLLPIPPLDGSRIVEGLVPFERRELWERVKTALPIVLVAVIAAAWWWARS